MRYYPKLQIFKNPNGTNRYDGKVATSYDWYTYAIVLNDKEIVLVEKAYSNTTSKHISNFQSLVGYDKTYYRVNASQGLGNLDVAIREINDEIKQLQAELLNPRNRNLDKRRYRISKLQEQLLTIQRLSGPQQKEKTA